MDNTLENKQKYLGAHWGTPTLTTVRRSSKGAYVAVHGRVCSNWNLGEIVEGYLKLKPLSELTDEDAIEFFDIVWAKVGNHKNQSREFKISFGKDWALSPMSERYGLIPSGLFHGIDFLRSRGYALPWMGLSIETLQEYGWLKLN
ncbi:hypothetical protein [uncultured Chryseobacterium sp.]|uniref:hypothetical protein n=1 Tax=uncultured Chryseobacterium sp. TaxID=259322 RepID=UPI0025F42A7A|nr:hypothetical protein [uncultured Chryseobacterium sp.]